MDADKHDKSIVEKTVDAAKEFAATVSDAAHEAVEPEPIKPGDEVVMMPMAAAGFMGDAAVPPFVVVSKQKNRPGSHEQRQLKKRPRSQSKRQRLQKRPQRKQNRRPAERRSVRRQKAV